MASHRKHVTSARSEARHKEQQHQQLLSTPGASDSSSCSRSDSPHAAAPAEPPTPHQKDHHSTPHPFSISEDRVSAGAMIPDEWLRRVAIVSACTAYFSFGFFDVFYLTCQLDLADRTESTPAQVAGTVSGNIIAYCAGCLLFGWINDRIDRRTGLIVTLMVTGMANMAVASSHSILQLYLSMCSLGLVSAGIDVAANAWMMQLGQQEANFLIQVMHFFYSVAGVVGPILLAPFLSTETEESRLLVPYGIVTSTAILPITLLSCLKFSHMYTTTPHERLDESTGDAEVGDAPVAVEQEGGPVEEEERASSPLLASKTDLFYKVMGCCLLSFYYGLETLVQTFLLQFAVFSDVEMDKLSGSYLVSLLTVTYAFARLISIPAANRLSARIMVIINFCIVAVALLFQLTLANNSEVMMWFSTALLGFGQGSCYPAIIAFLGGIVPVSDSGTGWFLSAARLTAVPGTLLIGYFVEDHPVVYPACNLIMFAGAVITFTFLCCRIRQ